jgi:hypothetical protein
MRVEIDYSINNPRTSTALPTTPPFFSYDEMYAIKILLSVRTDT